MADAADDLYMIYKELLRRVAILETMHKGDPFCWRYHPHPGYIETTQNDNESDNAEHVWGGRPCQMK